jgi:hypothetical protein
MESTRRLAYASWVVMVLYMFASRFAALLIGKVLPSLDFSSTFLCSVFGSRISSRQGIVLELPEVR